MIQGSIWRSDNPQGYSKEDLEEDLSTAAEDRGEPHSDQELQTITDQIWSDIDLTVKGSRGPG